LLFPQTLAPLPPWRSSTGWPTPATLSCLLGQCLLLLICVVFVATAAPCYLLTPLQFSAGRRTSSKSIWTKKGFFAELPEPSHRMPRLRLWVAARSGGQQRLQMSTVQNLLGMDTLDFSYLDMLCCRLRWVHTCARFVRTLTNSMVPAATPQRQDHRAATAVALMSLPRLQMLFS
jgi:hypothetical protein